MIDKPRIEKAVREILLAIGENPDREGLLETPSRVARMYEEIFSGLEQDPAVHLQKFFTEEYNEVVLVKDISLTACANIISCRFLGKCISGTFPAGR